MDTKKGMIGYIESISAHFKKELSEGIYPISFKRWLVRELNECNLTLNEAIHSFKMSKSSLRAWVKLYSDSIELPLPLMTSEEKSEKKALENRIKELEAQLAKGQMHVKALNTFIDMAEEQLKISIRKMIFLCDWKARIFVWKSIR